MDLSEDSITFGKYKGFTVNKLLRDRKYCEWLLKQDWFEKQYEYLYNKVKEYNPSSYFLTKPKFISESKIISDFLNNYQYFHLLPLKELKIELNDNEKKCYKFYLDTIAVLKEKIEFNDDINPYNIKAPTSWLNKFEKKYGLSRDIFKEFINAYDLPNIPYIVEDIKKMGGIEYKGARSFIIAKEKSLIQEKYWETILKNKYGEKISSQFKFNNCIFDFIHISSDTLFECKLGIKDFNEDQHNKYLSTLGHFHLIYLISNNCVIDLVNSKIFTTEPSIYSEYLADEGNNSRFDNFIRNFQIVKLEKIEDYFI